jgi:molybdenum cofactor cytidylyltransferase
MSTPSPAADVVVLAAGRSSRMGVPKGLVPFRGTPWLTVQLDAVVSAGARPIVVLGKDRDRYLEALPDLASRVQLSFNDDPDRGPFSSLQCGLAAALPSRSVFVLPIDVPAAQPPVWAALLFALHEGEGRDAAIPQHEGRGGHPVLLSVSLVARLRRRPADSRLDAELAELPAPRVARVPVDDPRVRLNLNAPEDWVKLELGR